MLARRFTIVCLLITVFGMGLSILVADKTLRGYAAPGVLFGCGPANPAACPLVPNR